MYKNSKVLVPLGLFIGAFVLRIMFVSSSQIANDEPFTIFYAQQNLADLFELFEHENNPPLHFVLLHFWMKLFGTTVFSVRFLSVLFGALTVIPIYRIGKKYFNNNVGIITALIFTLANVHIQEAHDTRVYTLLIFLCVWSYYLFFELLQNPAKRKLQIAYVLVLSLMLYAHYLSLVILFTQFITLLLVKEYRKKAIRVILITQALSVILFIPFLKVFITRLSSSVQHESWVPKPTVESLFWVLRELFNEPVVAVFAILALVGVIVLMITRKTALKSSHTTIVLLWFLLPYWLIFFLSFYSSHFFTKYLMFTSVGFYFVVAIFWDSLKLKKVAQPVFLLIPLLLMVFTVKPNAAHNRFPQKTVEIVKSNKTNLTLVVACPKWYNLAFCYHYNPTYFEDYKHTEELLEAEDIHFVYQNNEISTFNLSLFEKVIIIDGGCGTTNEETEGYSILKKSFQLKETFNNHPYTIQIWE